MPSIAWISSYPRSGNTWVRVLLSHYFANGRPEHALDTLARVPDINDLVATGNLLPPGESAFPTVLKTHFPPHVELMQWYRTHTTKVLYLVRNPRDVLLSSIPKLAIAPRLAPSYAKRFISNRGAPHWTDDWGTWVSSVRDWTDPDVLAKHFPDADLMVVRYEDLRSEPLRLLPDILQFLGVGQVDLDRAGRAVQHSSLTNMRAAEKALLKQGHTVTVGPIGRGLQNQSLASLGEDVEAAYRQAMTDDPEFHEQLRRYGYAPST